MPGNNLGFFGPEELRLRSQRPGDGDSFGGCQAGRFVMGIESDGAVKGCPSLPTAAYVGGQRGGRGTVVARDLGGRAASCASPAGDVPAVGPLRDLRLRGGLPGRLQLHRPRASSAARATTPTATTARCSSSGAGLRERIVPAAPAPGTPFDHGRFALVEEPFDAPEPETPAHDLVQLRRERRAR